jgi:hypothetical protein
MPWPELLLAAGIAALVLVPLEIAAYMLGAEVIVGFMYILWCIVRDHARAARRRRQQGSRVVLALCTCGIKGAPCAWCGGRP